MPALCVLQRAQLDVAAAAQLLAAALAAAAAPSDDPGGAASSSPAAALILYDQQYHHAAPALRRALDAAHSGDLQLLYATLVPTELDPPTSTQRHCQAAALEPAGKAAPAPAPLAAAATGQAGAPGCGPAGSAAGDGATPAWQACSSGGPCCAAPAQQPAAAPEHAGSATANPPAASGSGRQPVGGLLWELPAGVAPEQCLHVWLGPSTSPALAALQLTHSTARWVTVDPEAGRWEQGVSPEVGRLLKRR